MTIMQVRWIVLGLIVPVHVLLLGWLACCTSPTSDEVAHLAAGVRIWQQGEFDLYVVNPPLVKAIATIPVMLDPPETDWRHLEASPGARPEWMVGVDYVKANPSRFRWDFVMARWACLPFSILGLLYCFRWSEVLFGAWGGLLSASLWSFSPLILGNGALITPDVAATSLGLAACFHFRRWWQTGRWRDAILAGLVLGLAELTKLTWLLLYAVLPLMWVILEWLWRPEENASGPRTKSLQTLKIPFPRADRDRFCERFSGVPPGKRNQLVWAGRGRRGVQLLCLLLISLDVLNAGYLFDRSLQPLREFEFTSELLIGHPLEEGSGNRFRHSLWGAVPVPLPASYLTGFDLQRRDFESGTLVSYLRGELRHRGWWYYYFYGLLSKEPLGMWLIAACCLIPGKRNSQRSGSEWLMLLLPMLSLLLLVSSQTGFSRYVRYALPALPFLWIALGSAWAPASPLWRKWVAGLGLLMTLTASLAVYPHSLSFFNTLVGGPSRGHWHLLDSNVDWGQDLYFLQDWIREHPEATPLSLACSGVMTPSLLGIRGEPLPHELDQNSSPPPGWYAISANHLHGYDHAPPLCQRFLHRTPVARIGFSIFIYHVPVEEEPR